MLDDVFNSYYGIFKLAEMLWLFQTFLCIMNIPKIDCNLNSYSSQKYLIYKTGHSDYIFLIKGYLLIIFMQFFVINSTSLTSLWDYLFNYLLLFSEVVMVCYLWIGIVCQNLKLKKFETSIKSKLNMDIKIHEIWYLHPNQCFFTYLEADKKITICAPLFFLETEPLFISSFIKAIDPYGNIEFDEFLKKSPNFV